MVLGDLIVPLSPIVDELTVPSQGESTPAVDERGNRVSTRYGDGIVGVCYNLPISGRGEFCGSGPR
jgi:hypothetical protein